MYKHFNAIKRKAAETKFYISRFNFTSGNYYIASQISKCSAKSQFKKYKEKNIKEPYHISDLNDLSVDTLSGKTFLNKTVDDYIMIFTTIENCNYLKNSQFWILDGTFKSCPFFHLQHSIYRKIQELGLVTKYKNVLEFNFRASKIASLAFLPPEKVKEAWSILKSEFENDKIDLVTYFEENYVVGKIRMRFRKKEATRYEPFIIKI